MDDNSHSPGLRTLLGRFATTGMGAVQNRIELLAVEWQEERIRLIRLLVLSAGWLLLALGAVGLFTATVILLFPAEWRVYAAAGFMALYLAGAIWAWLRVRALLKQEPFLETIEQVKKDRSFLESIK
jgi:uncharacterized membrane protein YqjE